MYAKYFPGGNTGLGFFNSFDGIIPTWEQPFYTYVLKGGPGVGKNTLMQKVAKKAIEHGLSVELFPCASDPDSLDAVRVIDRGIVILDGTAPHSIDPIYPGAADEVIDLGHFKNQEEFIEKRSEVKDLFAENKFHYTVAYAYLRAARELKLSVINATKPLLNSAMVEKWIKEKFKPAICYDYPPRKLFAMAYTPDGAVDFSGYIGDNCECVVFGGPCGMVVMQELLNYIPGHKSEIFLDPLLATTPQHIHLIDNEIAFKTYDENDDSICNEFLTGPLPDFIDFNMMEINVLIQKAIDEIYKCKEVHNKIETLYRPYVNYDRVDSETEELLFRIGL